jgi:hypothetical protein
MKRLLVTIAILGAVVPGWPLLREDTGNECVAAESQLLREATSASAPADFLIVLQGSQGVIAKRAVEDKWTDPGYQLHFWREDSGLITHTASIGDWPGPYFY